MAKLWGLAAREAELPVSFWRERDEDDAEVPCSVMKAEAARASLSVLDALIERDEQAELAQRIGRHCDVKRRYQGISTMKVLVEQGISSVRIAVLTGVTAQAVRQRVARERSPALELGSAP